MLSARALLLFAFVAAPAAAEEFAEQRARIKELGRLTTPPKTHAAPEQFIADGLRALFFDALPHRGQPTRVFAWYGAPANRTGKVPGIVLVHGGGGTAYTQWVRKWNEHGFAAIAIAVEGQTSESEAPQKWKRHQWAGPARDGIYGDTAQPLADQWMYHAVADTILAHSLLRSFPEVDTNRIGIMGISWGGVITSTVIGLDRRFAFAIPTYGCGAMADAENQWGKALGNNAVYRNVWDPVHWLPQARVPTLWLTWLYDVHFPLTSQSTSYRAAPGPRMAAVLPDMKHSHPAGWNPPDSYAFAESIVKRGKPWLRQVQRKGKGATVTIEFDSEKTIDDAVLFSSPDSGYTGSRNWVQTKATVERSGSRIKVTAQLPEATRAWFFNVRAGSLIASSDLIVGN